MEQTIEPTTGEVPPPAAAQPVTPTWNDVVAASSASEDPKPRTFRETLTRVLSQTELLETGKRWADTIRRRKSFDAQTKAILAERKGQLSKIEEEEERLSSAFESGRVEAEIEVTEYVSLRLGKKWKVRSDTGDSYDEKPLSASERQGTLPLDGAQIPLGANGTSDPTDPEALASEASGEKSEEFIDDKDDE